MDNSTDQRQYIRYPLGLEATAVVGNNAPIERCLVHTISHSGASMNLLVREEIVAGQNIMLGIAFPERKPPLNVIVKLKWVDMIQDDDQFNAAAGGVIVFVKEEDRKMLLDYAFKQVLAAEKTHDR
ncbi:MAG: PilZ domain-containing protein [Deltaproteobacteria bacterium]|nr:PilZ domain-containing protein [Deltaproteobacteria bacterium]